MHGGGIEDINRHTQGGAMRRKKTCADNTVATRGITAKAPYLRFRNRGNRILRPKIMRP